MTFGFHRSRRGIVCDLGEPERHLLLDLLQQTRSLLESATGATGSEGTPGSDSGNARQSDGRETSTPDAFEEMMRRAGFASQESSADETDGLPEVTDPAVRRLLPDAHHDDPELAAEFRRLAGPSVRDRKLDHLRRSVQVVAASGGRLRLDEQEARSLLIAMNDVRLVLAERLGLEDDAAAERLSGELEAMAEDDPRFALGLGYEFLTWLQESLAQALTP